MKYTNLRAFEKHLESSAPAHLSPLYFVISKEPFERKVAVDKILHFALKGVQNRELCLKNIEGESLTAETLLGELNQVSFFGDHIAIVIQNAEKMKKPVIAALEVYLAHPRKQTYLILTATALASNTNFYKNAEKAGVLFDAAQEKAWEKEKWLGEWIVSEVTSAGKQISSQTCQYLLKHVGIDQALLQQEIQKLICYIGDRPEILVSDINALCVNVNMENIWQLGEAIFRCDGASAIRISKALLNEGTHLLAFLKQLRTQFQTEFQVCSILMQGGSGQEVAQQFPYMKGYILERHMQMAKNYGFNRFKKGLILIDQTETQAKNSVADLDLLSELLMIRLTA